MTETHARQGGLHGEVWKGTDWSQEQAHLDMLSVSASQEQGGKESTGDTQAQLDKRVTETITQQGSFMRKVLYDIILKLFLL